MPVALDIAESPDPGFPRRFRLVLRAGAQPDAAEQEFMARVNGWMDDLARIAQQPQKDGLDALRLELRDSVADALRRTVRSFLDGAETAAEALRNCDRIEGREELRTQQIERVPFAVGLVDQNDEEILGDRKALADDLFIRVNGTPISDGQTRLKVEIDRTITVVKVVLAAKDDEKRRSRYIRRLHGVARVGLQYPEPTVLALAERSLEAFREEFVAAEAGGVKNRYLKRLGADCLRVAGWAFALYLAIVLFRLHVTPMEVGTGPATLAPAWAFGRDVVAVLDDLVVKAHDLRNLLLLVAGTAIGTWLSFALRRVILTFLDLATLEEDRLDPHIRVLFVVAIALVVGLLLWTGAVTIGIGSYLPKVHDRGLWSLLLGLLLGISERTIATAVYRRASDFGGAVGGK